MMNPPENEVENKSHHLKAANDHFAEVVQKQAQHPEKEHPEKEHPEKKLRDKERAAEILAEVLVERLEHYEEVIACVEHVLYKKICADLMIKKLLKR
uniref:Uncharacterized protein n=1 Tax=Panagrolaimus sp. ES5 TaxID=591445 RepID=A0AC34G4U6_9BILA